jgi:hypothetical protein
MASFRLAAIQLSVTDDKVRRHGLTPVAPTLLSSPHLRVSVWSVADGRLQLARLLALLLLAMLTKRRSKRTSRTLVHTLTKR